MGERKLIPQKEKVLSDLQEEMENSATRSQDQSSGRDDRCLIE